MHVSRRIVAAAAAFAMPLAAIAVAPAVPAVAASAAALQPAGQRSGRVAAAPPKVSAVTLVTGDRVIVTTDATGGESVSVSPAPGAANPIYHSLRGPDGHRYVYPDSALTAVNAGTVDRALFDVTGLIAQGYDDASTRELPVIVQYADRPARGALSARAESLPASDAAPVAAVIPELGVAARRVDKAAAAQFWRSVRPGAAQARTAGAPTHLWLDRKVHAMLDESVPLVGAPQAWQAGFTGTGTKVAVLDTGVDRTHPDLAGQVVGSASFVPDEAATDLHGHGTHVASTIAGTGTASGGRYTGVAPGTKLFAGKVLNQYGNGQDSWLMAGMAWAVAQGADVVSMSLGGWPSNGTDPLAQAVNQLSASSGALFVIAAGNAGPGRRTVSTPATADAALAVASFDKQDVLAPTSSRGPRNGDGALKPEIAAPGVNITAARAAGTELGLPVGESYTTISGTSMATPHVAGAAAILAQQHPEWTGQQIKDALMSTAVTSAEATVYEQGAGRLDVARAVSQTVFGTGKADFGVLPAQDGQPARVRDVTYTNIGDRDVTLALDLHLSAGSRPVPEGAVTLSTPTLTVPAGGSATATLSLDPAVGTPGTYTGYLTATGAGVRLTTAVAYTRQAALHDLTIKVIGRHGDTPASAFMSIMNLDHPDLYYDTLSAYDSGEIRLRVPAGHYGLEGSISSADPASGSQSYFSTDVFAAEVKVTAEGGTVTVDARNARDGKYTVLGETRPTEAVQVTHSIYRTAADGTRSGYGQLGEMYTGQTRYGVIGSAPPKVGDLTMTTVYTERDPLLQARLDGSPPSTITGVSPRYTGRFDGTTRTRLVPAGAGAAGDYAGLDVRGKVALVIADMANGGEMTALAATAAAAGAAGIIVAPDAPTVVNSWVSDGTKLPVIVTSYAEGQRLRKAVAGGPARLTLSGVRESRFTYTLRFQSDHVLPADPTYTVKRSQLATVDNQFHADVPYHRGSDVTEVYAPWEGGAFRYGTDLVQPGRRTDYVTAGAGVVSRQMVEVIPAPFIFAHMSGAPVSYRPGQHARDSWFAGPNHMSGYTELACNFCRSEDQILFSPAPLGDANPTHYGFGGWYGDVRAYRNGVPVANPDAVLVPEEATYRIEFDTHLVDSEVVRHAGHTKTAWTFRSAAPAKREIPGCADHELLPSAAECAALPVILLGYDVPLDLLNQAADHRAFTFTVRTDRAKGLSAAPEVDGLTVFLTFDDGASWQPAQAVRRAGDGEFTVSVRHPRTRDTNGYVGLKVAAWDAAGNRTEQEILRAYGLRPGR